MQTTGSGMLTSYTSACMQPSDVAIRALAYDMNGITGATRAPYDVEQMTKSQIWQGHANVGQSKPTRDRKGFNYTSVLGRYQTMYALARHSLRVTARGAHLSRCYNMLKQLLWC
eukprot:883905-Pleurochrysis_carterae.AAC.3